MYVLKYVSVFGMVDIHVCVCACGRREAGAKVS